MIDQKLITFLKLCETMNYHDTAEALNMTQPAVTQHIKALEAEYNCNFFVYDHRTLAKSREAEILETYVRSAVFNEERLKSVLNKSDMERFRIGATKSIGEYMIGEITAKFLSNRGRTADITIDNTERLLGMLDSNMIDFALIEGSFSKLKYGCCLFRNEPMTGICAVGHPFDGKTLDIEELFSETLILREPGSGTRDIFSAILAEHGYSGSNFYRTVTVSEFSLICALVRLGTGISFVYESVADYNEGIGKFSISGINPVHELNYVFLKNTAALDMINEFRYPQEG